MINFCQNVTGRSLSSGMLLIVFATLAVSMLLGCDSNKNPHERQLRLIADMGGRISYNESGDAEFINLSGTEVGNESLEILTVIPGVKKLWLEDTNVTDEGVKTLSELSQLEVLVLSNTYVSNVGLKKLESSPALRELYLDGTRVNENGVESLRESNPLIFIAW